MKAPALLRELAALLDEVQREFEAAGIPLLSDVEAVRRQILLMADEVDGRGWSGE